ncbi:MAG: hypothetical protein DRI26_02340 [Chloroflexi bacterium]|nr:MAG: hypothetical protein DRI26_02340 [Chloroflexota bacterium]
MSLTDLAQEIRRNLARVEELQAEFRELTEGLFSLTEPKGRDFLRARVKGWLSHPQAGICPECGEDCTSSPLVELVYTFERCSCGKPCYSHLVEQLHHRRCYRP